MNDNHTDYGWNASTKVYDTSMLNEIDYYLEQINKTKTKPYDEQARFSADSWWYLYNYEKNRSPQKFHRLIQAIKSGHITVPLNPFVMLYGAMPTEAVIRAGYYPGHIERKYGVRFLLSQNIENHTSPWGLSSILAKSGAEFHWKGVCSCATKTPFLEHKTDIFQWIGPDDSKLLTKWYAFRGHNQTKGGYAEARSHLNIPGIELAIKDSQLKHPNIPLTGLFGAGHDDIIYRTDKFTRLASKWRRDRRRGRLIVSNGIDFFKSLSRYSDSLPGLRGGWGNDWDTQPSALSWETSQIRRAIAKLKTVEALAVFVELKEPGFWKNIQENINSEFINVFKYFEHIWVATSPTLIREMELNKRNWANSFAKAVQQAEARVRKKIKSIFKGPTENSFVVFNTLGFERTDIVEVPIEKNGTYLVSEHVTGVSVPSQVVTRNNSKFLQILAKNVPPIGYRVYVYSFDKNPSQNDIADKKSEGKISNQFFDLELDKNGNINRIFDKIAEKNIVDGYFNQLRPTYPDNQQYAFNLKDDGPVSSTLTYKLDSNPKRQVDITLFKQLQRIEVSNKFWGEIRDNWHLKFRVNMQEPQITFEEIGAIAKPGFSHQNGNFLPGTNAEYMTINHFVNLAKNNYNVTISSRDSYLMKIGNSSHIKFDLPTSEINILAVGNPGNSNIKNQSSNRFFTSDLAIIPGRGDFSPAEAMRRSLEHHRPLIAIRINGEGSNILDNSKMELISASSPNAVLTAFKPSEVNGSIILRYWELDGLNSDLDVDVSKLHAKKAFETTLIETDKKMIPVVNNRVRFGILKNEMKTIRIVPK